jgi:restriction endonuclease S subunit
MRHIKVPVPPLLPEQQCFIAAIEQLEQTITAAQAVIAGPAKKQAIMQAYLS